MFHLQKCFTGALKKQLKIGTFFPLKISVLSTRSISSRSNNPHHGLEVSVRSSKSFSSRTHDAGAVVALCSSKDYHRNEQRALLGSGWKATWDDVQRPCVSKFHVNTKRKSGHRSTVQPRRRFGITYERTPIILGKS